MSSWPPRSTSSSASTRPAIPFFVWFNTTHMHFRTHAKPESLGQSGRWQSEYHDVMIDHDKTRGRAACGCSTSWASPTTRFVMYSTDNGPHMNSWPDAGMTPFRNEKNSNWEGAYRVPAMVRWPGKIKAGTVSNEIVSHLDWLPTLLAMAGEPDITEKLQERTPGRQEDVQGAPGRLQPAAVSDRRREQEPAPRLLLLLRRRRPDGAAL